MNYEHHVAKQNAVYAEFRTATNSLSQLQVDPCIINPSAGYIVALRHSAAIMQPFSQFTASLRDSVPSLPYDAENGHTTVTVSGKQPLSTFEPDSAILDALCRTIANVERQLWQQVRIDFSEWYFNSESLIVAGHPNAAFWELGQQVQTIGAQHGLELRMPWGAHMTAGRFTQPCDANRVQALRNHLKAAPILGMSAPVALHVGYYTGSAAGFTLHNPSC